MLHDEFHKQIMALFPSEGEALLAAINSGEAVTSVRVNSAKGANVPGTATPVPWCTHGFYLPQREQFTFDPHFHAGRYYVQDASSMFLHHVITSLISAPVTYLDLCAAPGGKTTTAIDALPQGSIVIANEYIPQRAVVLADNVMRWGTANCLVSNNDTRSIGRLTGEFDVIAADVPCSGEGMFRKEAQAVAQWSNALVAECAHRQKAIIADVWQALKPGGLLIYSTCTYNREENEGVVEHIIEQYGAISVPVPVDSQWGIADGINTTAHCYRFLPHRTRGEGLFVAVLRKPLGTDTPPRRVRHALPKAGVVPKDVKQYVINNVTLNMWGDSAVATTAGAYDRMLSIATCLKVLALGTRVAIPKGKAMVPDHALALSNIINKDYFPMVEVDYTTAITYLRGEAITINAPRGYVLITYHDAILGFVNNLGSRANNLYPKPLRILSRNTPSTPPHTL